MIARALALYVMGCCAFGAFVFAMAALVPPLPMPT